MTGKSQKHWTADAAELLSVGADFSLDDVDPEGTPGYDGGKTGAVDDLARGAGALDELQERLYAQSRVAETGDTAASVLLVLQAMDSAGKGGIIRHVVGSVDPQGIALTAFKKPTAEELAHDFLWRVEKRLPNPGFIGVFDRSHYEDVLIGSVRSLAPADEIERRFGAINEFERRVTDAGTRIVKVMLHISADEQKVRLMERLDRPDKHWKYNPGDVDERELWPAYMAAYQTVFERTSTGDAPWHVVPANRKWYARLAVQQLLLGALTEIDPQWPAATFDVSAEKARLAAT
ncbi:PPK2 family polyphosphate kinase [Microbacterium pygmaeum]|uniref:Polyphosphate:nucleotide phosphotransferase, PPK2 family n=1 Tax=Microbacterium pygmaeum TaxID=370764 RepID=A0A1G7X1C9_9MICO|nr:PPK2 family polyphosphate kinase [Microbacterium pygmaeum]SDG77370.1 polyphosphate:nucleotide phosphotransferase, PPK2 family [Microbacterium pygmaeum]